MRSRNHHHKSNFATFLRLQVNVVFLAATLSYGADTLPALSLPEVDKLLEEYADDAPTTESTERLQRELRRPEVKAGLLAALKRDYFDHPSPNRYKFSVSLAALQLRSDLTADELTIVTNELRRLANKRSARQEEDTTFIRIGLLVLKNYPSSEHEALVLRFADDDYGVTLEVVCETLQAIGTSRSLPVIEAIRIRLSSKNPISVTLDDLEAAITSIKTRMADGSAVRATKEAIKVTPSTPASNRSMGKEVHPVQ